MTGATDSFATLTFTYNNNGWLLTDVTSGPGSGQPTVTLTYGYDQFGDETSVTDSLTSQGMTTYTYSSAQQLTNITTSYGGTSGPQVAYTYDNASRLTSIERQVGTGSTASEVNTAIAYDIDNRVVTVTDNADNYIPFDFGWVNTPLATYVYSDDQANRVTSETDAEGTYTYAYDNANELTTVTENSTVVGSYSYDLNGNRNSTGYTTGTDNELTASPGVTYSYDNAGNMTGSTNTSTHVTTTYTYDYRDRLTEVTTGGTVVATYTYNALDQRIGVKDSGTQTWTAYDGKKADANPYADFNGSGSLAARYLFGPGVVNGAVTSVILARTSPGGTTNWYLTDNLGSVRDIVDTSGDELDHVVYDSFGNIVTETNATNGDRFKFAGMQYDTTVGQYFDHARWYGPTVGRYLAQDPIGFSGQDGDLYRYVGNDPINHVDVSGLMDMGCALNPSSMLPGMTAMMTAGAAMFAEAAAAAQSVMAAGTAVAMAALPEVAVAEAAYATYLTGEGVYWAGALGMATMAGWQLDAQLQQARMRSSMALVAQQMSQLNARGVLLSEEMDELSDEDFADFTALNGAMMSEMRTLNAQTGQWIDPDNDPWNDKMWEYLINQTKEQMAKLAALMDKLIEDTGLETNPYEGPSPPSIN
jgi:RHS repeat-associated protein